MRTAAAALLLITALAMAGGSATVEIKNCTSTDFYFVWVTESGREKWIDMLGLSILPPDSSAIFQVTEGFYDFRIEDCEWRTYSFSNIPIAGGSSFVWEVLPVHEDTD
ncbi:MAG TPA: hypothetical protein P5207_09845 [Candidatus Sabulitectum sp.]|nr:hypothetical protein [Candidatus Sabulitectum sp.]HRW78957.1 hypothetical protein [Candidatus Sabulitectum sp.]